MQPQVLLQEYRAERDELLRQIQHVLTHDGRVCATWLWGSLGRGDADELSDLDVWIVVADEYLDQVAAERWTYVARVGAPLVMVDAPQNAPANGAYLLAVYAGDIGPHQVDWYWQAQSAACVPRDTRMLFERVTLPRSDADPLFPGTQKPPDRGPLEQIAHSIHLFWAMLPIAAKHVARWSMEDQSTMLEWVRRPLMQVQAFLDLNAPCAQDEDICSASNPVSELALLRAYAARMETLLPRVAARGVDIPEATIVSQVHRYLDLIEAKILLDQTCGADRKTG
jgi:predicted nucleotidyltransferase